MRRVNVLITGASRRVPLVRAFRTAVESFGKGRVITTDTNPLSPALYFGHRHHLVPKPSDKHFIPIIESICDVEDVSLIVPTNDDELPIVCQHKDRFQQLGIVVAGPKDDTSRICNDRYEAYILCRKYGVSMAEVCLPSSIDPGKLSYPVYAKPRHGGSVNGFLVHNDKQLGLFLDCVPNPVVQAVPEGVEFTVDVLSDFRANVVSVVPRERIAVRSGISDKGVTRKNTAIMDFAKEVAERLGFVGASTVECKWDGKSVTLIEVHPRFSSGIALTIASGADFPSWLVQMADGTELRSQIGKFKDGLTMMSFEESIYASESELQIRHNSKPRMLAKLVSTYVN